MLIHFNLDEHDREQIRYLALSIAKECDNLEEIFFLTNAAVCAQELPRNIRRLFYSFKMSETAPGLLLTNNPVSAQDVGPTPSSHWRPGEDRPLNLPQIIHGLYAALLGEVFGFDTQQRGRLFNDLISIPGAASNSSSGDGKVGLHTEDISQTQPFMPDYLGFLCLRNEQKAVTTLSSLQGISIPDATRRTLFEQCFPFRSGEQRPILFGDPGRPYLRISPVEYERCSAEMLAARQLLMEALHRNQQTITLGQGDCLYLDNSFAVHGRAPFSAEYGAKSRWFSRVFVLRDLRRIRPFTASSESRIMVASNGTTVPNWPKAASAFSA